MVDVEKMNQDDDDDEPVGAWMERCAGLVGDGMIN